MKNTKTISILCLALLHVSPAFADATATAAPPAKETKEVKEAKETKKTEAPAEAKPRSIANNPEGNDLPIMAEKVIRVVAWDKKSRSYQLVSVQFPGEGIANATPKGMTIGISSLNLERLEKDPESIVGEEFETTAELPILFPEEVEDRAAQSKKSRK